MICPSCRSEVPGTPKFCNKCGAPFATPAPPTPAAAPATKVCPQCGAVNALAARFCRQDGYKFDGMPAAAAAVAPKVSKTAELTLEREPPPRPAPPPAAPAPPPLPPRAQVTPPQAPRDETNEVPQLKRRPGRFAAIIAGVIVVTGGAAGALYWKGIIGDRPGSVAEAIMESAQKQGFTEVTVTVSQDWVADVSGIVIGTVKKDELLALVRQNSNIKSVTESLTVHPGPEELEQQITDLLTARGIKTVTPTVGADLIAILTGTVDEPTQETVAIDTARKVAGLKDVRSAIKVSLAARQAELTAAIAQGGFDGVTVQMADENTVNVSGNVHSQVDKDKLTQLVTAAAGAATVNDTTQIVAVAPVVDAAKIEAEINKALQKAGLGAIAAVVDDNLNATLVGTVTRASDRDRALKTARKVTSIKNLRSEIEVTSAAPAPAAPAPVSPAIQQSMALNAVKGQWAGRVDTGLFGYVFTLNIAGGAIGQDVGTSVYGSSAKGMCGGSLTLTEINPNQQFVFTENLDRTSMMCPGGGTLKMQVSGDGKALFEWYRPKNPTKRYAKGAAERR
jgi:osmotically-inducible protein OsmY